MSLLTYCCTSILISGTGILVRVSTIDSHVLVGVTADTAADINSALTDVHPAVSMVSQNEVGHEHLVMYQVCTEGVRFLRILALTNSGSTNNKFGGRNAAQKVGNEMSNDHTRNSRKRHANRDNNVYCSRFAMLRMLQVVLSTSRTTQCPLSTPCVFVFSFCAPESERRSPKRGGLGSYRHVPHLQRTYSTMNGSEYSSYYHYGGP